METKYKILIGLGIGAITGSLVGSLLYSLLNKNKDSQRPSSDSDNLTIETIQYAREKWLIDDTFYVDSRVPAEGNHREKAMNAQIKRIVKKFGVEKPEKTKHTQITIFQEPEAN